MTLALSAPEMVLRYINTLVWPSVAALALFLFKRQLAGLIGRVSEISAAGSSVKFGQEATELADRADRLAESVVQRVESEAEAQTVEPALPIEDPTLTFLAAYRELEMAARDAGPTARVVAPLPVPVLKGLAREGLVPSEVVEVGEDLRRIRNEVAHGARRLEASDAANLAATARSLASICLASIWIARHRSQGAVP